MPTELLAHPALCFFLAAAVLPLCPRGLRALVLLGAPLLGLWQLTQLGNDYQAQVTLMDYALQPIRIDRLNYVFALIFHLAAFGAALYSLHLRDRVQDVAALMYMGAVIAASLAGDLFSLFVCWEISAVSSVFLIWSRRSARSYGAGFRYLIMHIGSGVTLAGAAIAYHYDTGSLAFTQMDIRSTAGQLLLLAIGIKAAFPLLHNWLQDAYSEATATGTVILSAFTTKLAVYALARSFAGLDGLIWIGCAMIIFPSIYALLENDLRKVLAYSLNNQLGFMVVAVGIGTELALNGMAAHAFVHIIYKSLLFMCLGAVLHRVGSTRASELGGLYRSMPLTTVLCLLGGLSAAALPLTGGFISKSLIAAAVSEQHLPWVYLVLLFGSVAVLDHAAIKTPLFGFFGQARSPAAAHNQQEAPGNMLLAMALCAVALLVIGCYPQALYPLLPFAQDYQPYHAASVLNQLQLSLFAALGFALFYRQGWYPRFRRQLLLDSDWFYRKLYPGIGRALLATLDELYSAAVCERDQHWGRCQQWLKQQPGFRAALNSHFCSSTSLLTAVLLVALMTAIGLAAK